MNDELLHPSRILVVDDQETNALLLQAVLARAGYTAVETMSDPMAVLARCSQEPPDLLLLDWHMPGRSGAEILEDIAFLTEEPNWMPVLVLTADVAPDTKRRALSLGARDFLTKPIDVPEVLLRVRNLLQTRYLRVELQKNNDLLHERVSLRTRELEDAKLEMLDRLALAAEYRDDATGQHAYRIGRTSELIALALGLDADEAALIGQAARLHDIGKIGIADDLLLKPGKYTAEELGAMELHPAIGARILSGSTNELLRKAEQIALTHHERWDGRGYPGQARRRGDPPAGPDRHGRRRVRRAHAPPPLQGAVAGARGRPRDPQRDGHEVRPASHRGLREARPRGARGSRQERPGRDRRSRRRADARARPGREHRRRRRRRGRRLECDTA